MTLLMALPVVSRAQALGRYQIDAHASRVEVRVFKSGLFGDFADNHVIVLKRFSGTAVAQSADSWRVHVAGESGSLTVADPGASDSTRQEIEHKMLGQPRSMPLAIPRSKSRHAQWSRATPPEVGAFWLTLRCME